MTASKWGCIGIKKECDGIRSLSILFHFFYLLGLIRQNLNRKKQKLKLFEHQKEKGMSGNKNGCQAILFVKVFPGFI